MSLSDWKLKLRYGKTSTQFKHFTALGAGTASELAAEYECPDGPAIMGMKTWALDTDESADMLKVIGAEIGFKIDGEIEIYETEPVEPPRVNPYGYDITFTPYSE